MSPLIMKRPKSDKTLTRKPKSKDELVFIVFVLPSLVDVELGADEDVDESDEENWELIGDVDMILSTTTPKRGEHSQGQRIHK
jgi:hypothetical protein